MDGSVPLDAFDDSCEDAAIVASLTSIKGIGIWTAEMFLIFSLNRPDVLPVHDLGVRRDCETAMGWPICPGPANATPWPKPGGLTARSPSWYIWRNVDTTQVR